MNILALCTGSSARSILLERLLRRLGQGKINAFSAGSQPSGKVHPQSLVLLAQMGFRLKVGMFSPTLMRPKWTP